MQNPIVLDGESLTLEAICAISRSESKVALSSATLQELHRVRSYIDEISQSDRPYYGINTGFGGMAETKIAASDINKLQRNLILSHACGVGEPLAFEEARVLMLLRANTLAKGFSGVRPVIVENLVALLNHDCAPFVPRKGSVGASGDLAPLAHLAMLILGEGDALVKGKRTSAREALSLAKIEPVVLQAKEGLSLINGTQAMAAVGSLALFDGLRLCALADMIGACSLEGLKGSTTPFDARIHHARPHKGQIASAEFLLKMLEGSEIRESHLNCKRVQDPYSLRCMPQVHGASRTALAHIRDVIETEINSCTDNPLVFKGLGKEPYDVLSGGNFHGQPLALALDYLAIACAELANISERRLEQMINPALSGDLPAFLTPDPGLNSGFMVMQVTAAALINENKVLCHPASTDSIPTSANREDHVSMGMTSANKARMVVENVFIVLGIELMAACQALEFRGPLKPGIGVQKVYDLFRREVSFAECDRVYQEDMSRAVAMLRGDVFNAILSGK
jgi:histidine ammonia-lyase